MPATAYLLFIGSFAAPSCSTFIDKAAAECILAGMMTDTGNFSYNCNDPELYIVVAELLRKGADKEKPNIMLFDTFSASCLRLNAYAILRKMELLPEVKRRYYTSEPRGTQPLPLHPRRHRRARQQAARYSKRKLQRFHEAGKRLHQSIHAEPWQLPVNIPCADYFGGGGHLNAAGVNSTARSTKLWPTSKKNLPEIRKRFIDNK